MLMMGLDGWSVAAGATHQVVVDTGSINTIYRATAATQTLTGVTVASSSNSALVVIIQTDTGGTQPTITGVTWDVAGVNQPLSLQISEVATGGVFIYGAKGITAGASKTITITSTGSVPLWISSVAFTGVDQTTPFPHTQTGTSASTLSVTSATGNIVALGALCGPPISGITGTTIFSDSVSGINWNTFANYDNGSATTVIGEAGTFSGAAAVDIKAA